MKFSFIDAKRAEFPVARLCEVLEVSQSGYFAWKNRPASERQCKDMVLLAHIRERFRLSQETYGARACTPISLRMVSSPGATGLPG
jgi:putative transposase